MRSDDPHAESSNPPTAVPVTTGGVAARWWALALLAGAGALLAVAVWLEPDPRGYGTHERLGSGPCGMLVVTGLPCPTCGMTTAFSHTVRGHWVRAFLAQPAGFLLALGTVGLAGVSLWTLVLGRWPRFRWWVISPYYVFMGLLVLLVGAWAFKIAVGLANGTLPYR